VQKYKHTTFIFYYKSTHNFMLCYVMLCYVTLCYVYVHVECSGPQVSAVLREVLAEGLESFLQFFLRSALTLPGQ